LTAGCSDGWATTKQEQPRINTDGHGFEENWLRNRNTVEFIGVREQVHNPDFNYGGFATTMTGDIPNKR
jgi:hypothetical protein